MIDNRFEYIRNQIIDELIMENKKSVMTETTMKNNTKRAIGTTTGLMLQTLGKAVENPGEEVEFIDHHEQKHAQLQLYKIKIELFAKALNLDISVDLRLKENCVDYGLFVKSNWVSPYSQRTPAEEKWKEIYGFYPAKRCDAEKWEYFQQGFESAK
jgi:hypothetical protein